METTQIHTQNEKLILIDDIFRAKKMLYGLGIEKHIDAINNPGKVFDQFYDLTNDEILLELSYLHAEISLIFKKQIGAENETYKKPD